MKYTLTALGCALALTCASSFAQQQSQGSGSSGNGNNSSANNSTPGPTLTEKMKQAAHAVSEKTKDAVDKMKVKTNDAKSSDDGNRAAKSDRATGSKTAAAQLQDKADANFKAAKAKCGDMGDKSKQAVCQKQAVADHANAEVKVEKTRQANSGSTSTMGAGRSSP